MDVAMRAAKKDRKLLAVANKVIRCEMNVVIFVLVHPCDKADKAGCEQNCEKKGEEDFVCTCSKEFKLNADGKKCDKSKLSPMWQIFRSHLCHNDRTSPTNDFFNSLSNTFFLAFQFILVTAKMRKYVSRSATRSVIHMSVLATRISSSKQTARPAKNVSV